jgi:hypothetical protein
MLTKPEFIANYKAAEPDVQIAVIYKAWDQYIAAEERRLQAEERRLQAEAEERRFQAETEDRRLQAEAEERRLQAEAEERRFQLLQQRIIQISARSDLTDQQRKDALHALRGTTSGTCQVQPPSIHHSSTF